MILVVIALGAAIGVGLGGLGAGGSILAVPVLVHVAGLSTDAATATSLVAVGAASLSAAIQHRPSLKRGVVMAFVPTGVAGAVVGAAIGEQLAEQPLLLAFSVLVMLTGFRMLQTTSRPARSLSAATHASPHPQLHTSVGKALTISSVGLLVGILTGLFGAGGGFVIVPALTLVLAMPMTDAVASSLAIVAVNAAIGLAVRNPDAVDWPSAMTLTVPMLIGGIAGSRMITRFDEHAARHAFGALLIAVAILNAVAAV